MFIPAIIIAGAEGVLLYFRRALDRDWFCRLRSHVPASINVVVPRKLTGPYGWDNIIFF